MRFLAKKNEQISHNLPPKLSLIKGLSCVELENNDFFVQEFWLIKINTVKFMSKNANIYKYRGRSRISQEGVQIEKKGVRLPNFTRKTS